MIWTRRTFITTSIVTSLATIAFPHQAKSDRNSGNNSGSGRPINRTGGIDRGYCNVPKTSTNRNLIAIVPEQGEAFSLTPNPTLWFYVPYAATEPLFARFSLRDEQDRKTLFAPILIPISGTPGIIGLRLPQALEAKTSYHWYLTIVCQAQDDGPGVDGWMQRVEPDTAIKNQLKHAVSLLDQIDIYRKASIWFDRLTLLAEHRDRNPQVTDAWAKLLQEINLPSLTQEPISPCCQLAL